MHRHMHVCRCVCSDVCVCRYNTDLFGCTKSFKLEVSFPLVQKHKRSVAVLLHHLPQCCHVLLSQFPTCQHHCTCPPRETGALKLAIACGLIDAKLGQGGDMGYEGRDALTTKMRRADERMNRNTLTTITGDQCVQGGIYVGHTSRYAPSSCRAGWPLPVKKTAGWEALREKPKRS